jgi:hypothetical protein
MDANGRKSLFARGLFQQMGDLGDAGFARVVDLLAGA